MPIEGVYSSEEQRALVYARSKGQLDSHPFGTELDVYSDEYEWLAHSMTPNADVPAEWRVDVGSSQCDKPYSAALLNISAMSFGSLSANAIMALNKGAAAGNFYHDTGEGGISRYHRSHGGDLVWEIGSGYFGCRKDDGSFDPDRFADNARDDQVKMIEIKISQGAKPGHGGVLPGTKVTEEIAEARGVTEIGWEDLMPEGEEERLAQMYQSQMSMLYGGGGVAEGSAADAMVQIGTFNTVKELNGKSIRLPGYTVPFEYGSKAEVTEFLMVPYFGACIHAPPPPPNQTVFVTTDEPILLKDLAQAVWVEGILTAETQESELADAAYTLKLTHIEKYEY